MRNLLFVVLLFSATTKLFAQNTTLEEYTYMTKGLVVQFQNGLDMKRGYELKKFSRNFVDQYKFTFSLLLRENKKDKIAGIVVYAESNVSGNYYVKAIPLGENGEPSEVLYKKYIDSMNWDNRMTTAYSIALTNVLLTFLDKIKNDVDSINIIE
ncbi:hypothetical protein ACI760_01435 [Capnocytophaga canimorsus]|uniref:hypothetical protein n=1 Tax=Capnocytophaga canimorsus TaxID=28188 RepID=UPI00385DD4BB